MKRFSNKVALVTGAGSGIGYATSLAFAQEGAKVVAIDHSKNGLSKLQETFKKNKYDLLPINCDVSDPENVECAIKKAITHFHKIDCAFNNAGIENTPKPIHEIDVKEWDNLISINLRGVFLCMKYELQQMNKQGYGSIVNTSSGAGIRGVHGGASYCASKHGVIGMTKAGALDYAKKGIRINAVLPGNIETPMMERFTDGELQKAIDLEPIGRLGKPSEIAKAVLFLCSKEGEFITGSSMLVDGGWAL